MQKIKILFFILLISVTVHAQKAATEQKIVQQAIENMFTALTNGDTSVLKTLVTSKVHFYEYGQIWNIDTIISITMMGKTIPDFKRTNSFEFISTTVIKKTAWVTYYLQSVIAGDGKQEMVKWLETVVLIKDENKWKIDVLHSTRMAND